MTAVLANAYLSRWMLLGATGLTGRMVLDRAVAIGLKPTLAGRDLARLRKIGDPLGLPCIKIDLADGASLKVALAGHALVLNAAGPFATTALPVICAAMAVGADYIDLNGEYATLELLLAMDDQAREAGIALIGGAGFGVAATDGIALQVDARLGGADSFRISVATESGFATGGVADSTIEVLRGGGVEVLAGQSVRTRLARRRWAERTDAGKVAFASAPLAEIAAVRAATSATRITAGVPMRALQARALAAIAPIIPLMLKVPAIARALANTGGHRGAVDSGRIYRSRVWVQGTKGRRRVTAVLEAGEGFALAADIALLAVQTALAARPAPGAYTPATAFGAGLIDRVAGVSVTLVDGSA